MSYTTYARIAAELKGTAAQAATGTEQQIMQYARTVTSRIKGFGFDFEPLFYTRKITPTRQNVNSSLGTLTLGAQLLEPTAIAIGTTDAAYGSTIVPFPDDGQYPITQLRIADLASGPIHSWLPCCGSLIGAISITGFWGMRENYASTGFFDSGIDTPVLTATQVTMVVSSVAGPDIYNRVPMFSAGNLIRVDNELMEVVAVDTTTKTLTLIRGARGTTAVAHDAGAAIRIWEVEEDIVNCATRQACLLYARRGSYQQITTFPDGINVTYPSDLLAEVRATVQRFNYVVNA